MFDRLILIGYVSKSFGIKGQIKLNMCEEIEYLESLIGKKIYISYNNNYEFYIVENDQIISKKRILSLKDINNINQIEKYINCDLFVIKDEVEIQYKINLIGYSISWNNKIIGHVVDTLYNGSHDLIKVKLESEKHIWIPMVDKYIIEINDNNKNIIVIDIEGL